MLVLEKSNINSNLFCNVFVMYFALILEIVRDIKVVRLDIFKNPMINTPSEMYAYVCMYACRYIYAQTYIYVCAHLHACVCVFIHAHIDSHIHLWNEIKTTKTIQLIINLTDIYQYYTHTYVKYISYIYIYI